MRPCLSQDTRALVTIAVGVLACGVLMLADRALVGDTVGTVWLACGLAYWVIVEIRFNRDTSVGMMFVSILVWPFLLVLEGWSWRRRRARAANLPGKDPS